MIALSPENIAKLQDAKSVLKFALRDIEKKLGVKSGYPVLIHVMEAIRQVDAMLKGDRPPGRDYGKDAAGDRT